MIATSTVVFAGVLMFGVGRRRYEVSQQQQFSLRYRSSLLKGWITGKAQQSITDADSQMSIRDIVKMMFEFSEATARSLVSLLDFIPGYNNLIVCPPLSFFLPQRRPLQRC